MKSMVKRPGTKAKGRNHEAGLVAVKRPDLSHKTAIPVAQRRNLHKNLHKQRYYKQGLMTKTGKKLSGITVIKTRRGAGADARARWEGKETAASSRGWKSHRYYSDGGGHSFQRGTKAFSRA